MTIEDILAKMQSILDENKSNPSVANDAPLTDDQSNRYESLERDLKTAQKSDEIQKRNAAYNSVRTTPVQTATNDQSDDTLARAFNHYVRTGKENQDIVELRAQSEGTGSEGGFLVPDLFRTKLVERMKAYGGIANVAEEFNTSTGNPVSWPTMDDTGNVGEIVAEGGTFSAGADVVLGTANLGAYRYMAGGGSSLPLRVSVELLQDAAFDVEALVSRVLGTRIGRIQATHLATGTGVAQPKGLTVGMTPTASAAATLVYSDLVNYVHALDPAYRNNGNCKWVFNDNTLKAIRKILDTTGRPLVKGQDEGVNTAPGAETLLGYPVTIDQGFSDLTNNSTQIFGAFGDITEGYVVRRVRDVTLVVNPWTRAANGQVEYTAWARMDATQQNTNAYVALTGHS